MKPYRIPLGNAEIARDPVIMPRRGGYVHRDIIAVNNGIGLTEDYQMVHHLPRRVWDGESLMPPHIWVTADPAHLLMMMVSAFGHLEEFTYQMVTSHEVDPDGKAYMSTTRLTRFGFKRMEGHRNQAMHVVWSIGDMMRNPTTVGSIVGEHDCFRLMLFAKDVRDWCKENDIPIGTSMGGIASSLLRDARFYPHARGRVPQATNENIRPHLPGVYSELRAEPGKQYHLAASLDQRTAYHRAAQDTPLPDSTTLFARGYFHDPESSPIWAHPGSALYERTIKQPGLLALRIRSRVTLPNEARPPVVNFIEKEEDGRLVYLYTNEVSLCEETGVEIIGIVAAWTSTKVDEGMPRYGKWAQAEIERADDTRKKWLKPLLHSTYGLLAARARALSIGHLRGKGKTATYVLGRGYEFSVHEAKLGKLAPATTNVAALGMLQAEQRVRSMRLANALMADGVSVLHIHADGIHIEGQLPLVTGVTGVTGEQTWADLNAWKIEPRTNLTYIDRVSWVCDEGACLPGRDAVTRDSMLYLREQGRPLVEKDATMRAAARRTWGVNLPRRHVRNLLPRSR